jgi:rod shape-determining protein MreC
MTPVRKNLKSIVILTVIIVLCLIIITVSFKDTDLLKKAKTSILDLFKPIQEKTFLLFQPVNRLFSNIGDYFKLKDQVESLEKDKEGLLKDYSENINLKIENDALRKLLDIKLRDEFKTVPAKVIGYYEGKWQSEIILNIGGSSGIREGMAVINDRGLVGTVILSSSSTCKVRLINDPQSNIGARILSSRKLGIVQGSTDKAVFLNYIPVGDIVFKGDILITSEYGEYIPPEILIGRIKRISEIAGNPYMEIEVEPFADFKKIEYVLVVKE